MAFSVFHLAAATGDEKSQTAGAYTNQKYGYKVRYPSTWFASGIRYGNAFKLRNYDPKKTLGTRLIATALFIGLLIAACDSGDSAPRETKPPAESTQSAKPDTTTSAGPTVSPPPPETKAPATSQSTRSAPPDTNTYTRPVIPEDVAPGGKRAIPKQKSSE